MKSLRLIAGVAAVLLLAGCSSTRTIKVAVPPRVDLGAYPMIGLVTFESNADAELEEFCTQKFLQAVQDAQPGTRMIELGSESQVLASVGRQTWDAATLRAIQETHGVDVVLAGRLNMKEVKPKFNLATGDWKNFNVRADVEALLSAKLIESATGASMWTDSSQTKANIATASFNSGGSGHIGAVDPEAVYGEMVDCLVHDITDDFRVHYVTRRVPKDQVQTAGAGGSTY